MKTLVKEIPLKKDIVEIFEKFKDQPLAAFLHSSAQESFSRFSIIGLYPYLQVIEKDGNLVIKKRQNLDEDFKEISDINRNLDIYSSIESFISYYINENNEENSYDLPIISGCIGYFSYDHCMRIQNLKSIHKDEINIYDGLFVFYDNFIIYDKKEDKLFITSKGILKEHEDSIENIKSIIESIKDFEKEEIEKHNTLAKYESDFTKEEYEEAVEKIVKYIEKGDTFILNLTQQFKIDSNKDPYFVFKYLSKFNPAPFSAYLNYGDFKIISASPERFILVKDGLIETRPIKGTRPRGETVKEDEALKNELANSEKNRSELLMIVDLERNDLNNISKEGSVRVDELFVVETYATVFQLVSTIRGKLKDKKDIKSILEKTMPGGSITGAPKIRTMEIIDSCEKSRRNIYTGAIGYIGFDFNMDFNIIIRTLLYKEKALEELKETQEEQKDKKEIYQSKKIATYYLGVGGGISYESNLEFGYEEKGQKAKALLEALGD